MKRTAVFIWVALAIGAVAVGYWHQRNARANRELHALEERRDVLRNQRANARERAAAAPTVAAAPATSIRTAASTKTTGEDAEMQAWLAKWAEVKRAFREHPEAVIPELQLLDTRGWLAAIRPVQLESEEATRQSLAEIRDSAKAEFGNQLARALAGYLNRHKGTLPPDMMTLAPYFNPPADPAILARYTVVNPSAAAATQSTAPVILETNPVDLQYDNRAGVSAGLMATGQWGVVAGRYSGRAPWPGSPRAGR